jgi:hypothetical protein
VKRARTPLLLVALAIASAAAAAGATAQVRAAGPDPRMMAMTTNDVGYVARVEKEGYTTRGPIAATRGYRRAFSGLAPGTVQYLTVENTVLVGKDPAAAQKLIASIVAASKSQAGLASLYRKNAGGLAASLGVPTAGGSVTRAKAIKAGDGGAELLFHFVAPEGDFQGGQVFVRVGGNLSVVSYGTVYPGVPAGFARLFAINAAARLAKGA